MLTNLMHIPVRPACCLTCTQPQCNDAEDLLGLGLFDNNGNAITVSSELLLQQQQELLDNLSNITATNSDTADTAAAMASYTAQDIYDGVGGNCTYSTLAQSSSSSPEAVAAVEAAAAAHYGLNLAAHVSIYHHCTNAFCSCTS
jgi:uncharacterized protein YccT (UPF0319 family)